VVPHRKSAMSTPINDKPPSASWLSCRTLGVASGSLLAILSLAFVFSYNLNPAGPGNQRYVEITRIIGKTAFTGDLLASGLAVVGWFVDRKKVLAILVAVSGVLAAGAIGMYVYNI
jgi:hypothetical protein